mgnify:FL=1
MTVKEFFKSSAFRSLAVLIAIVLVAGVLLAICNDIFFVSDEERFARSIAKIYGAEVETQEIELTDAQKTYNNGQVEEAYLVLDDGNYLLHTTGYGGYSGGSGTVTLWVVIGCDTSEDGSPQLTGIEKVVYDSNDRQTLMSNFNTKYYEYFTSQNEAIASGGYFTAIKGSSDPLNNIVAGASQTSKAMVNAVNTALACFRTVISGGQS